MKAVYIIGRYQLIRFLRNKVMVVSLWVFVILSIFSLFYGKSFVDKQEAVIYPIDTLTTSRVSAARHEVLQYQDSSFSENRNVHLAFQVVNSRENMAIYRPSAFASFSIGQKDNYPYYNRLGFSYNAYDIDVSEIQNPDKLQAGNFDLSFIFIYLTPLFIIAMGYHTLSGEEDNQTYRLLKMEVNDAGIMAGKLLFLFMVVVVATTLVSILGFCINGMNLRDHGGRLVLWLVISVSYFIFWIGVVTFVISFKANSSVNALVLGGVWIVSLLLIPSVIHSQVTSGQEDQLVDILLNNRGDGDNLYEIPEEQMVDSLYTVSHPYSLNLDSNMSMQRLRYIAVTELSARRKNAMGRNIMAAQRREYEAGKAYNIINPAYVIQHAYNRLAETEIENYHNYLLAAEEYQTKIRYKIYNYQLRPGKFTMADYDQFPVFSVSQPPFTVRSCLRALSPLYGLSILLYVGGALVVGWWRGR